MHTVFIVTPYGSMGDT